MFFFFIDRVGSHIMVYLKSLAASLAKKNKYIQF